MWLAQLKVLTIYSISIMSKITDAIENLEIDISPRVKFLKVEEPPARKGGVMVADVKELIQKLKYEAKVI